MIRVSNLFTVAFLLASTAQTHAAADSAILGVWARGDGVARVRVIPCGGALCAINTWIKPGVADEKVGDRLVMQVKPAGPATLSGAAFDPQRNLNYRMKIDVSGATMTTRGCVLGGLICKNMGWTRLSEE